MVLYLVFWWRPFNAFSQWSRQKIGTFLRPYQKFNQRAASAFMNIFGNQRVKNKKMINSDNIQCFCVSLVCNLIEINRFWQIVVMFLLRIRSLKSVFGFRLFRYSLAACPFRWRCSSSSSILKTAEFWRLAGLPTPGLQKFTLKS